MDDERADGRKRTSRARPSSVKRGARGEFDLIESLRGADARLASTREDAEELAVSRSTLITGIGDDAAVFRSRAGRETVITTDMLVEGVDFDLDRFRTEAREVGHKSLAVSLSDLAAMGARPLFSLLSVGLPAARWRRGRFLEEFYEGVRALAEAYDVALIGGDISRTPERVVVDSVALGEVRRGRAVLRSGAKPGDLIYVTGSLGGAAAGLRLLRKRAASRKPVALTPGERRLVRRQLAPVPRVEWGMMLGEHRLATAMIDLSDGLSSDLAHVCRESRVGARIEAATVPLDPSLPHAAVDDEDALALALDGGEDFELLFTVSPRAASRLPGEVGGVRATCIGEVTRERGKLRLVADGRAALIRPAGYEHFAREGP